MKTFRGYWVGWNSYGDQVYSKDELDRFIKDRVEFHRDVLTGKRTYTIIKEFEGSRRFMRAAYEGDKLILTTIQREVADKNGDYGA